jgi:hypothetical protein
MGPFLSFGYYKYWRAIQYGVYSYDLLNKANGRRTLFFELAGGVRIARDSVHYRGDHWFICLTPLYSSSHVSDAISIDWLAGFAERWMCLIAEYTYSTLRL